MISPEHDTISRTEFQTISIALYRAVSGALGDHAKNIGEDAVYAAEAEDIRHIKNAFSAYN